MLVQEALDLHAPEVKKSKVVSYRGHSFVVPDYIKYMATDGDGTVNGFTDKPKALKDLGYWMSTNEFAGQEIIYLADRDEPFLEDWYESMREIK